MTKMILNNKTLFKSVFILGGTSEIAQEICFHLVRKGTRKIHLLSRKPDKNRIFLEKLNNKFNVEIINEKFDLLESNLKNKPNIAFYDLYIIAAGYLGNTQFASDDLNEAFKIARVNYYSLIPWINAITSESRISQKGFMWILSSVAGDKGRPSNFHYGAAKAALTIFCEGLLNKLHKKPFKIRIIKAGYIKTSMSADKAPKFLTISTNYLAKTLIKNPYKDGIQYLPFWWLYVMKIISLLPKSIISKL